MRYKTILFDADQTLWDFNRAEAEALSEVLESNGFPTDDNIIKAYHEINDALWKLLELGKTTKAKLKVKRFSDLCERFGLCTDASKLADEYVNILATKAYTIEGAIEMCEKLSGACKLYMITNGIEKVQSERFMKCGMKKYFSDIFISENIGFEKPDVRYFNAVVEKIPNFKQSEALVVGDSITSDIKGGNAAKLDTCWYNPNGKKVPDGVSVTYNVSTFDEIIRIILD